MKYTKEHFLWCILFNILQERSDSQPNKVAESNISMCEYHRKDKKTVMGKRYGNVGGNYNTIDGKCMKCKYLSKARKDPMRLSIGGHCTAGYCKKCTKQNRK